MKVETPSELLQYLKDNQPKEVTKLTMHEYLDQPLFLIEVEVTKVTLIKHLAGSNVIRGLKYELDKVLKECELPTGINTKIIISL